MPSNQMPELKAGVEFINQNIRSSLLMNLKSLMLESNVTYLVRSDLIVGGKLIFDPKNSTFEKYDLGFSWSAGTN
jgi:hypothetical protein